MRFVSKLKELVRRVNHLLTFLSGEGSWSLKQHEKLILDAALGRLDEDARKLAGRQFAQNYFMERGPHGRINVIRFYHPAVELQIPDDDFFDLLIKVKFRIEKRQQTAHVTFYKGLLFSIEFKKPGKFYAGKSLEIVDASIGKPNQTYTYAIDRLEHGETE